MSAVSRIVAVSLFVIGIMLGNSASAAPQTAIDEMRALVTDAYVAGGWSERDAGVIAEVKVQRMVARDKDGSIPDFAPQDHRGTLTLGSNGVAAVQWLLTTHYEWEPTLASFTVWNLYSELNEWTMEGPTEPGTPSPCRRRAYLVVMEFCETDEYGNPALGVHTAYWNTPCVATHFVENECITMPNNCECPEGQICSITYELTSSCGDPEDPSSNLGPGTCVRVTHLRILDHPVDCSSITPDLHGGCESCMPAVPYDNECLEPVLAACHEDIGDCPACSSD